MSTHSWLRFMLTVPSAGMCAKACILTMIFLILALFLADDCAHMPVIEEQRSGQQWHHTCAWTMYAGIHLPDTICMPAALSTCICALSIPCWSLLWLVSPPPPPFSPLPPHPNVSLSDSTHILSEPIAMRAFQLVCHYTSPACCELTEYQGGNRRCQYYPSSRPHAAVHKRFCILCC